MESSRHIKASFVRERNMERGPNGLTMTVGKRMQVRYMLDHLRKERGKDKVLAIT